MPYGNKQTVRWEKLLLLSLERLCVALETKWLRDIILESRWTPTENKWSKKWPSKI